MKQTTLVEREFCQFSFCRTLLFKCVLFLKKLFANMLFSPSFPALMVRFCANCCSLSLISLSFVSFDQVLTCRTKTGLGLWLLPFPKYIVLFKLIRNIRNLPTFIPFKISCFPIFLDLLICPAQLFQYDLIRSAAIRWCI